MSHSDVPLARRYAKALFELAAQHKSVKNIKKDLDTLSEFIVTSHDLQKIIGRPIISRNNQSEAIDKVLEHASANKLTRNFISVLAANRRLNIIEEIIVAFNEMLKQSEGSVSVEIISATKLSKDDLEEITKKIEASLKSKVDVTVKIDESLLGGIKIKIGSMMLDGSLSGKIAKMELLTKEALLAS